MIITFKTKLRALIMEILIPGIGSLVIFLFVAIYGLSDLLNGTMKTSFVYIFIIIVLCLYFAFIRSILIAINYYRHDKNKIITIDTEAETIEIIQNGKKIRTNFSNIYIIYRYYGSGIGTQYYYKLVLNEPIDTGEKQIIFTFLTITFLKKYVKNVDYIEKDCFNLFIPKKKNNA